MFSPTGRIYFKRNKGVDEGVMDFVEETLKMKYGVSINYVPCPEKDFEKFLRNKGYSLYDKTMYKFL